MKQIGLGMMQYTQDYDERYPRGWGGTNVGNPADIETDATRPGGYFTAGGPGGGSGRYRTWMDFTYPYTKSLQIYLCPSVTPTSPEYPHYGYSLAVNNYDCQTRLFGGTAACYAPIALAEVQRPSEIVVIAEHHSAYSWCMKPWEIRNYAANPADLRATPHLDGAVMAYTDGHAKWRSRAQIVAVSGSGTSTTCSLTAVNDTLTTCSRGWNPYIP